VKTLLILALVASAGCGEVTASIKPSELARLDGYHDGEPAGGPVQVLSPTNQRIEVAGDSKIFLELPGGTYGGTFKSIHVSDGVFNGVTDKGQVVTAPLATIQAARVEEPNRAAMGPVFAVGVLAGLLTLVTVSVVVLFVTLPRNNGVGGRALRVARRVVAARTIDAAGWDGEAPALAPADLAPELRAALARLWTDNARAEHASVPAFSRLALSLVALGAPARLVEAAHRAALEEIEHARLSFSLAAAYAGAPVGPGPLPELRQAPAVTATTLEELAVESLIDGCLLEGAAAEVVRRGRDGARDPGARAALAVIAPDEASHAALAWEVVRWCCARGGEPIRRRVTAALDEASVSIRAPKIPAPLAEQLADHGWLGQSVWDDALRRVTASVTARIVTLAARD
jgi:hypothetical protein